MNDKRELKVSGKDNKYVVEVFMNKKDGSKSYMRDEINANDLIQAVMQNDNAIRQIEEVQLRQANDAKDMFKQFGEDKANLIFRIIGKPTNIKTIDKAISDMTAQVENIRSETKVLRTKLEEAQAWLKKNQK